MFIEFSNLSLLVLAVRVPRRLNVAPSLGAGVGAVLHHAVVVLVARNAHALQLDKARARSS